MTVYTRSPKTRLDDWITGNGIVLCFHEGGTFWHEDGRAGSLYIHTVPDNCPKENISILLLAHTCEKIKEAVEEYNSRPRDEYAGANLHYSRSLDDDILTENFDRTLRRRKEDIQHIPDFLFKIK
ncbi:MAG TPA: hypothetical protein P5293_00960 [Bacteroidales bacterium]|nr:hypothetical protein [Bacteroidales bacterium]